MQGAHQARCQTHHLVQRITIIINELTTFIFCILIVKFGIHCSLMYKSRNVKSKKKKKGKYKENTYTYMLINY